MRRIQTTEEKVVKTITKLLADLNLDLEAVGKYISNSPTVIYNRLITIADSAEYEKEKQNVRNPEYTLFD
jgi:hypothetical protein